MKIRKDYVSNSSSSSYIISLSKNYEFNQFVDDVVKACTEKTEYDYEPAYLKHIDDVNRRNLDYCLNTYRLLYLGDLMIGTKERTIKGKTDCDNFLSYYNRMKDLPGQVWETIVSQKDDEIIVKENHWMEAKPISWDRMDSLAWLYGGREEKETDQDRKNIVDKIVNWAKNEYYHDATWNSLSDDIELYEITMDTILNTEDLLKLGHTIWFDDWNKDLNALKERIKGGQRLFGIRLNQGGDGMDVGTIFGTNGWDSNWNSIADVEVLHCECG